MDKLRVGDPLDKSVDMGAIVDKSQLTRIKNLVSETEGQVYYAECEIPKKGLYYNDYIRPITSSCSYDCSYLFSK